MMAALNRYVLALTGCVLTACVSDVGVSTASAPNAHAAPHKEHKPLDDKAAVAKGTAPAFAYRAAGRRDPFRSYLLDAMARRQAERSQRQLEETESYELSQYHLTAVLTGTSQPKAMIEDPTGKAFVVRIGSRVGRAGGRVSRIDSTGIVVLEENLDPQGQRSQIPITLKLPAEDIDDPALGPGAPL
jgi:Tfp pilus assembly protein PilP